jgi:hypothetical protein
MRPVRKWFWIITILEIVGAAFLALTTYGLGHAPYYAEFIAAKNSENIILLSQGFANTYETYLAAAAITTSDIWLRGLLAALMWMAIGAVTYVALYHVNSRNMKWAKTLTAVSRVAGQ